VYYHAHLPDSIQGLNGLGLCACVPNLAYSPIPVFLVWQWKLRLFVYISAFSKPNIYMNPGSPLCGNGYCARLQPCACSSSSHSDHSFGTTLVFQIWQSKLGLLVNRQRHVSLFSICVCMIVLFPNVWTAFIGMNVLSYPTLHVKGFLSHSHLNIND